MSNAAHTRSPWTKEEDSLLMDLIQKYGDKHWNAIAAEMGTRTGKGCSHRWRTYLRPDVKHPHQEPFTDWEAAVIIKAQKALGNNWMAIAKLLLPGRINTAVKNYWHCRLKAGTGRAGNRLMKLDINQLMKVPQKFREAATVGTSVPLSCLLSEGTKEAMSEMLCPPHLQHGQHPPMLHPQQQQQQLAGGGGGPAWVHQHPPGNSQQLDPLQQQWQQQQQQAVRAEQQHNGMKRIPGLPFYFPAAAQEGVVDADGAECSREGAAAAQQLPQQTLLQDMKCDHDAGHTAASGLFVEDGNPGSSARGLWDNSWPQQQRQRPQQQQQQLAGRFSAAPGHTSGTAWHQLQDLVSPDTPAGSLMSPRCHLVSPRGGQAAPASGGLFRVSDSCGNWLQAPNHNQSGGGVAAKQPLTRQPPCQAALPPHGTLKRSSSGSAAQHRPLFSLEPHYMPKQQDAALHAAPGAPHAHPGQPWSNTLGQPWSKASDKSRPAAPRQQQKQQQQILQAGGFSAAGIDADEDGDGAELVHPGARLPRVSWRIVSSCPMDAAHLTSPRMLGGAPDASRRMSYPGGPHITSSTRPLSSQPHSSFPLASPQGHRLGVSPRSGGAFGQLGRMASCRLSSMRLLSGDLDKLEDLSVQQDLGHLLMAGGGQPEDAEFDRVFDCSATDYSNAVGLDRPSSLEAYQSGSYLYADAPSPVKAARSKSRDANAVLRERLGSRSEGGSLTSSTTHAEPALLLGEPHPLKPAQGFGLNPAAISDAPRAKAEPAGAAAMWALPSHLNRAAPNVSSVSWRAVGQCPVTQELTKSLPLAVGSSRSAAAAAGAAAASVPKAHLQPLQLPQGLRASCSPQLGGAMQAPASPFANAALQLPFEFCSASQPAGGAAEGLVRPTYRNGTQASGQNLTRQVHTLHGKSAQPVKRGGSSSKASKKAAHAAASASKLQGTGRMLAGLTGLTDLTGLTSPTLENTMQASTWPTWMAQQQQQQRLGVAVQASGGMGNIGKGEAKQPQQQGLFSAAWSHPTGTHPQQGLTDIPAADRSTPAIPATGVPAGKLSTDGQTPMFDQGGSSSQLAASSGKPMLVLNRPEEGTTAAAAEQEEQEVPPQEPEKEPAQQPQPEPQQQVLTGRGRKRSSGGRPGASQHGGGSKRIDPAQFKEQQLMRQLQMAAWLVATHQQQQQQLQEQEQQQQQQQQQRPSADAVQSSTGARPQPASVVLPTDLRWPWSSTSGSSLLKKQRISGCRSRGQTTCPAGQIVTEAAAAGPKLPPVLDLSNSSSNSASGGAATAMGEAGEEAAATASHMAEAVTGLAGSGWGGQTAEEALTDMEANV